MKFSRFFSGFISVFLIFTITFQVVALPFSQPKKAEASAVSAMLKDFVGDAATGLVSCAATWGVSFAINEIMGLITDVPSTDKNSISLFIQENCLRPMAKQIALGVLQKLTESTVSWINGGYKGNPFYIRDLGSYLTSVTNDAVKNITYDIQLGNSPYSISLSSGLINSYIAGQQSAPPEYSLNNLIGENTASAFSGGDFKEGGWNAWLASTVVTQNNSIGASIITAGVAQKELAKQEETQKQDVAQNDGFLSMKKCVEETSTPDGPGCDKYETSTPGSMISDQLKETGGTSKDQLLSTDDLAESFMAIFSALLTSITTDGVSSLSSDYDNSSNNFGGYGSNTTDNTMAGTLPGWTSAGGTGQDIDLDNLQQYTDLMQKIIDRTAILIPKMETFIDVLYEADYCVPGPRSDWYEFAQENLRAMLNNEGPVPFGDTNGDMKYWFKKVFGMFIVDSTDTTFPGYGDDIRTYTNRALDGDEENNIKGYKHFIEKYYSMVDNIPSAFSINKEFQEVDDYEILVKYNQKRSDQATVYKSRITFLQRIYDGLPPTTDPLYIEKRAKLQEDANSILAGIYTERNLEGINSQISDMDAKYLYMTNEDLAVAPKGLIPMCISELGSYNAPQLNPTPAPGYPPTNRVPVNRRPYPTKLLPQDKQDAINAKTQTAGGAPLNIDTFLPFVKIGPLQQWPDADPSDPIPPTPANEFYWDYLYFRDIWALAEEGLVLDPATLQMTTVPAAPDPRVFEAILNIY